MPLTVERLRTWILVAAGVLVLVLSGFFYLGHWKQRFLRRDLPQKLGLDIQQDSTGFTLSKSHNGKTLFTLHASRAVQLKNGGNAQLHDVKIILYGQGESQRQDRISGDEFSYDPKTQIVQAQGTVLIDLQSPDAGNAGKAGGAESTIHMRTDGLTFNQKTGVATTTQPVEFRLPQAEGTAVGAEYDSQQGLVTLASQVVLHTTLDQQPATVDASHAVMNRQIWQVILTAAQLHSAKRDASADHATLWMHPDGSADHMLAEGRVVMTSEDGTELHAPRGTAQFRAGSHVEHVHVDGGVTMHQLVPGSNQAVRDGQAEEAWLDLDAASKPANLRMQGGVHLQESVPGAAALQRELRAGRVDVPFRAGVAQQMMATMSPIYQETSADKQKRSVKVLQADTLEATLRDGKILERVHGIGNTQLTQQESTGEVDVSHGDDLVAKFAPAADSAMKDGPQQIVNAVQQGNVRFSRSAPAKKTSSNSNKNVAGMEKSAGHAARAEYTQADDTILLTGDPHLNDISPDEAVFDVSGGRITLHRDSGDGLAEGAVKCSYVSQPGAATAHVIGDRAVLSHAQQTATFTGSPRLWQEGNSVEAPMLVLTQKPSGLEAESGPEGNPPVRAVFVQRDPKHPGPPVRVTSHKLVYSDAERRAHFTTGVTLVDSDGTVRANKMDVFLKPSGPTPGVAPAQAMDHAAAGSAAPMAGQLDHILATGDVVLEQPLRQGTGEQLVYTASDGKFVLTGSSGRPPRIEDRLKGTVTGETLIFLSHDNKVDVENGPGRTVTTTHLSHSEEAK